MQSEISPNNQVEDLEPETRVPRIYNLKKFEESHFSRLKKYSNTQKHRILSKVNDPEFYLSYLTSRLPILDWLPKYKLNTYIIPDMVAGLTVGVMNIPQVL